MNNASVIKATAFLPQVRLAGSEDLIIHSLNPTHLVVEVDLNITAPWVGIKEDKRGNNDIEARNSKNAPPPSFLVFGGTLK